MTFDPVPAGRRVTFQPWMAFAGAAVVVAAVATFALMRGSPSAFMPDGARMQVEVVPPNEPEVQPGGVMEVGELVDGYSHVAIHPQAVAEDVYEAGYQTAWVEPPEPEPVSTTWRSDGAVVRPTQPQEETTGSGGRFGFDAPGPDYAAERRARQERLDRIQAEQAAGGSPGAPTTAPGLDRDSAFY